MKEGDEVVVLDTDRRRGKVEVIDQRRLPGPPVKVGFGDELAPVTGWYYETRLAVVKPIEDENAYRRSLGLPTYCTNPVCGHEIKVHGKQGCRMCPCLTVHP